MLLPMKYLPHISINLSVNNSELSYIQLLVRGLLQQHHIMNQLHKENFELDWRLETSTQKQG